VATTWYTFNDAKLVWADIPTADGQELLDLAKEQIVEYATDAPYEDWEQPAEGIPVRWRRAQLLHARAVYTAIQSSPQDTMGGEQQSVRVYPLGWQIRSLIHPPRHIPGIG
jgi:hypothetical protein